MAGAAIRRRPPLRYRDRAGRVPDRVAAATIEMSDSSGSDNIFDRLQKGGEEAIGRVVQDLIENPVFTAAVSRAFDARERASQAQEAAMGALNIPSAADLARLTRRVRSVGQRLEGVEDSLDRLESRLGAGGSGDLRERLQAIEEALSRLEATPPAAATPRKTAAKKPTSAKSTARKPAAKSRAKAK